MKRWNQTHEALSQAAVELFACQGYNATGTAQIAARAGVSEMTLFRHFPSKEALLLADPFDPLMAAAVRERPWHEPAMQAVVEGIRQALTQVDERSAEVLRDRLRIVAQTPLLRGAIERNSTETADALVGALVEREIAEEKAMIAANAVIAGLGAALLGWAQAENTTLETVLNEALDVLAGE